MRTLLLHSLYRHQHHVILINAIIATAETFPQVDCESISWTGEDCDDWTSQTLSHAVHLVPASTFPIPGSASNRRSYLPFTRVCSWPRLAPNSTRNHVISVLFPYTAYSKANCPVPICLLMPAPASTKTSTFLLHFRSTPPNIAFFSKPFDKMTPAPFRIGRSRLSPPCVAAYSAGCKLIGVRSASKHLLHHLVVPARAHDG